MVRAIACIALLSFSVYAPVRVRAEEPRHAARVERQAVSASHPLLRARLDAIAHRSALWRAAVEAIGASGRRALVLTSDEVVVSDSPRAPATRPFDDAVLAEVAPVPGPNQRVDVVLVVINLNLLHELGSQASALPAEMQADIDRLLVHEVYGHALPYLIAGNLSGRCQDPVPGQHAREACAIQRENAVRAELGLEKRLDYGLQDLALVRRALR